MTDEEFRQLTSEIDWVCKCLACCCPPGRGHNHPRFEEWYDEQLRRRP
jgi:hypothetical protein